MTRRTTTENCSLRFQCSRHPWRSHVVSRCVRRAWLWGFDEYAGRAARAHPCAPRHSHIPVHQTTRTARRGCSSAWRSYRRSLRSTTHRDVRSADDAWSNHRPSARTRSCRRSCVPDMIGIPHFPVSQNHYHLVVHVDQARARSWTMHEVIERWTLLFARPPLIERWEQGLCDDAEREMAAISSPVATSSVRRKLVHALKTAPAFPVFPPSLVTRQRLRSRIGSTRPYATAREDAWTMVDSRIAARRTAVSRLRRARPSSLRSRCVARRRSC
jgi:hypothetical protein